MTSILKYKDLRSWGKKSIPYVLFLIAMIAVLSLKINVHVDEVYTYGLSNSMYGIQASIEDGKQYPGTETPFKDYMTVQIGERLEFGNVWENQENDVHPPLYYALVHLVSSFFPNEFSIWQAGLINIIFGLLSLYVFRKLCAQLTENPTIRTAMTFLFIFSAGILMNISFLRMYVMAMFWVLLLSDLVIAHMKGNRSRWLYPAMGVTAILGAITHYYCIVYIVAISIVYGLYLLVYKKDWRSFAAFLLTMLIAAGCSWLIFPAMTDHLFSGYRGTEALNNFGSSAGYARDILSDLKLINTQIFGDFLPVILIAAGALFIYTRKKREWNAQIWSWIIIGLPALMYFLLIAKVAPYQTDRYMFPIYPLIMILVMIPVLRLISALCSGKKAMIISFILTGILCISSLLTSSWQYLFRESAPLLQKADENSGRNSIYVYEQPWEVGGEIMEMQKYKTVTFINLENTDLLNSIPVKNDSAFVLNIPNRLDPENYAEKLVKQYHLGTSVEYLGSYGYGSSYLVKK